MSSWSVEHAYGGAGELHRLDLDSVAGSGVRIMRVNHIDTPALVMSSTQNEAAVSPERIRQNGIELARRRSGGGLVHLVPSKHLWADLFVPRQDPLWTDDVGRSSTWLGQAWQRAFEDLGLVGLRVHSGEWSDRPLGQLVCFAATGPGEVSVGDRKLVGISQRRTRAGARFQCTVYFDQDVEAIVDLLNPEVVDTATLERLRTVLRTQVVTVKGLTIGDIEPTQLVEALLAHLP